MKFGEKIKLLRQQRGITQSELAEKTGLSLRTIRNYELDGRYPRHRSVYTSLAEILETDVNYLLTEDEQFVMDVSEKFGSSGAEQAEELVKRVSGLFAGGELDQTDKDAVMQAIMDAYWMAKKSKK